MSSEHYGKLLSQNPIFLGVGAPALQIVLQAAHMRQVARNQFVIRQGDLATAFYVLIEGHAKLIQVTPDGHEILVRYIRKGQEFGVIAVLSGFDYPLSIQTVDECQLLVWPGEVLAQLMERYSHIAFSALRVMVKRNQDLLQRYQELLTEHVEQRVAQALLRLAEQMGRQEGECVLIDMPFSREDLAELTGTTMYTVSRILSKWERRGFVDTGRERVLVCRPEDLMPIAWPPENPE